MTLKRPLARTPRTTRISRLVVKSLSSAGTRGLPSGRLLLPSGAIPCSIGKSGATGFKREGDGMTPLGRYRLLGGYYRRDRIPRVLSAFDFRATMQNDGWCDDVRSPNYNRPVRLPCAARHELLTRDDGQYDVLLVLGYNLPAVRKHRGSAIFFHIWRSGLSGTEGCVALSLANMRKVLPRLSRRSVMEIVR